MEAVRSSPAGGKSFKLPKSDFRLIRLGDLNLLKEVATHNIVEYREVQRKRTGALIRRVPEVVGARKTHHARIHGSQEIFTAVVYESSDFEKVRPCSVVAFQISDAYSVFFSRTASSPRRIARAVSVSPMWQPSQPQLLISFSHPSLVQLFGSTSSLRGFTALIYQDGKSNFDILLKVQSIISRFDNIERVSTNICTLRTGINLCAVRNGLS
jgi:hypothetical protein